VPSTLAWTIVVLLAGGWVLATTWMLYGGYVQKDFVLALIYCIAWQFVAVGTTALFDQRGWL
jgi:hypothetical protein